MATTKRGAAVGVAALANRVPSSASRPLPGFRNAGPADEFQAAVAEDLPATFHAVGADGPIMQFDDDQAVLLEQVDGACEHLALAALDVDDQRGERAALFFKLPQRLAAGGTGGWWRAGNCRRRCTPGADKT